LKYLINGHKAVQFKQVLLYFKLEVLLDVHTNVGHKAVQFKQVLLYFKLEVLLDVHTKIGHKAVQFKQVLPCDQCLYVHQVKLLI
jgi:hypothetical protein